MTTTNKIFWTISRANLAGLDSEFKKAFIAEAVKTLETELNATVIVKKVARGEKIESNLDSDKIEKIIERVYNNVDYENEEIDEEDEDE